MSTVSRFGKSAALATLLGSILIAPATAQQQTPGQQGMQGMPGMGGMQGMGGMHGMQGMGGMQGMQGMGGMQGMQGMGGMQGMHGMGQAAVTPGIDSTDKARQVAQAWLQVVQARAFDVGDVHDIEQIFVVNIVHKEASDKLRDQLIIRKTDGYTFPVFPLGIPQMTAMAQMPGMGGMQGMPGMGGMYGMPGMGGMQGMPGMGGMQGMPGMTAEESKTE